MRKITAAMILCFVVAGLAGCSAKDETGPREVIAKDNEIVAKQLSREQQEVLNLVEHEYMDILLYDFKADSEFKDFTVWLEIYENGALMENLTLSKVTAEENTPLQGQLALSFRDKGQLQLSASVELGTHTDSSSITKPDFVLGADSMGSGGIGEPAEIQPGKSVALHKWMYSDGDTLVLLDPQEYIENPERLREYKYAALLMCRFDI